MNHEDITAVFQLESIGANHWRALFTPYAEDGLKLARVAAAYGEEFELLTAEGPVRAETTGALRYGAATAADLPATGDWVAARVTGFGQALIHAVLPRRTVFSRRAAGSRHDEQVLAANLDAVFIVCGLDHDYNERRVERYLALTKASGAEVVIVLSKADLCTDVDAHLESIRRIAVGAETVAISSLTGAGLDRIERFLGGDRTIALLGSSGAGKSTLANAILGDARQRTAAVRESDSRGRHTTTRRELIPLPRGGALIDTPGLRELQLWADADSVDEVFEEISALAAQCRFRDCRHDAEEGCAVRAALGSGEIDPARWQSWRKLRAEAEHHERLTDHTAALEQKRKWKAIHKAARVYKQRW